jgi:hypothetical protein
VLSNLLLKFSFLFTTILAIFGLGYLKGKRREENKQLKTKLKTYEESKKIDKEVKNIDIGKLNNEYSGLYDN